MKIIESSSRIAAEVCGLADRAGTLENGKRADLAMLGSNPLEDIRAYRDIHSVYKFGKKVFKKK